MHWRIEKALAELNKGMAPAQIDLVLRHVLSYLAEMEEELSSPATPPSETSSVVIPGPAPKPSESFTETRVALTVNQEETLGHLARAIAACIKSTRYISHGVGWTVTSPDSSTLRLTLTWPTVYGLSRDGDPGRAVPIDAWPIDMHNEGKA